MKDDKENEAENIRVAVRCRPMNERELREQAVSCFVAQDGNAVLTNLENPTERHEFGFDYVYGIDTPQPQVFNDIGIPILDKAFAGYNGTIFAYGQTGSGKTFSMNGVRGHDDLEGLIPRMNRAIFERIAREKVDNPQKLFLVECSFFEIYNEVIFDLLDSSGNAKKNKAGLEIKEHGVLGIYVKDLQERVVESRDEVVDLMQQGQNARTVGYTQMNAESSRSHSIFIIKIHQKDAIDESKNIFAKINLVDLAGSERAASTGAQGDRLKEGANINKSLSALGNVINALVEASRSGKKVFIPYRNSKLTRVLQESLGGNSLCSMLATLSPANINFVETLSTLKYASRAKAIKVNAKKNESSSQISQLNEEIAALKKKLMEQTSATLGLDPKEKEEIVKKYEQQIKEMDRIREQTWEDKTKLSKQHELERKRLAKEKALADQKVREERTRKWKLLEEKGDVELMLRALRDLDRTAPKQAATDASGDSATTEEKWLIKAQAMKVLETEAKDHRTMIMVFKDSVDKDVDQWSKRLVRHDSTTSAAAKRDDTAATHMIVNQLCSKLQNVFDESKQLVQMEKKVILDGCDLINEMMSELIKFKERRQAKAPALKPSTTGASQQSKEEDQVQEEREKGLSMTLALIQRQRAKLVTIIRSERQKMFNLAKVSAQFVKYMDSYIVALESVRDANSEASASLEKWKVTKEGLAKATEAWESELPKTKKLEENAATAADSIPVSYVPKGEVSALGLESKLVGDDCLYASSRKPDVKHVRMNSPQFWLPDEQDSVPFIVVDLEFPRFVQSVAIRGGNTAGSPPIATSASTAGLDSARKEPSPTPVTTFELKPPEELEAILSKYKLDEITGESEPIHELLGHVMSWNDLLKSNVLPAKLFSRPPVRFLHDIISVVIHNTGYAKDLFSVTERDYANLNSKSERVDYLTKILDFVQEEYRAREDAQGVVIAATASNILAGKEPTDTLKFLGYFAIAAMRWGIKNPPTNKANSSVTTGSKDVTQAAEPAAESGKDTSQAEQSDPERKKPSGRSGWVRKMRISTSLTGKQWRVIGDFDANIDDVSLQMITFSPGANAVGRFIQLTCIDWNEIPLFQVEIYGQEASESDELVKSMDGMGEKASQMIQQLLSSAALFADEAKASWEKAKDAEREKQEELIKLMAEITRLKQANAQFEKEIKEIQQANTTLQQSVKMESKKYADEKTKNEKLQDEAHQSTACIAELKKEKETLGVKLNEHAHSIQTITLQISEQKKDMESLLKSKTDLEDLCTNLRSQLQSKNASEGHQESKLASVMGDLMSVNVQLDEFRRRYETSELMRKEQEAASQQMHTQLQNQLSDLSEKENAVQRQLHEKIAEAERALEVVRSEKDELRKRADESSATATASNAANEALRVQVGALQDEVEAWKVKAAEAQERASANEAIQSAAASAISQQNEQLILELQTKELRYMAELEKAELKLQACEQKQQETDAKFVEVEQERDALNRRISELGEQEEELQFQLQIVTEERDAARAKEEQLFTEGNEKDQEIERIRDGYVWVTDRMNMKEDELAELQEQLEKYQALLEITTPSKKTEDGAIEGQYLVKLYTLATGHEHKGSGRPDELAHELSRWIEHAKALPAEKSPVVKAPAEASTKLETPTTKVENAPKSEPGAMKSAVTTAQVTASSEIAPKTTTQANHSNGTTTEANQQTPKAVSAGDSKKAGGSEVTSNRGAPEGNQHSTKAPSTQGPEKTDPAATRSVEPVKTPTVKVPPEPNHGPTKEPPKQPEAAPKPTKSPRSSPPPKLDPKPELEVPTKPATPRRERTPQTSARRLSASESNGAVAPSNQATQRSDDGYDDDFDADEPELEAKRQLRRKESVGKA